jgi:hypothetical protein
MCLFQSYSILESPAISVVDSPKPKDSPKNKDFTPKKSSFEKSKKTSFEDSVKTPEKKKKKVSKETNGITINYILQLF